MNVPLRNPLVAVDWNFIQTVPLDRCQIPHDWDLLLPDEAAHEIADKPDAEHGSAHAYLGKFIRFCRANSVRVWLGFTPGVVCARYRAGRVRREHLLHGSLSRRFRRLLSDPTFTTKGFIEFVRTSDAHQLYLDGNRTFDSLTKIVRDWLPQASMAERRSVYDPALLTDFIRDPQLLRGFTHDESLNRRQLRLGELLMFPDVNPYGAWSRLMVWYACRRARLESGSTKDSNFSNCYADAACAFLGRFSGHLLTDDRDLREAATAIAPGMRLYRWSKESTRIVRVES